MGNREFGYEPSSRFVVDTHPRTKSYVVAMRWATLLFSIGCWALVIWAAASVGMMIWGFQLA